MYQIKSNDYNYKTRGMSYPADNTREAAADVFMIIEGRSPFLLLVKGPTIKSRWGSAGFLLFKYTSSLLHSSTICNVKYS